MEDNTSSSKYPVPPDQAVRIAKQWAERQVERNPERAKKITGLLLDYHKHGARHRRTGRRLDPNEVNLFSAISRVLEKKTFRDRQEQRGVLRHDRRDADGRDITVEDVLRYILEIHEGKKRSRELWQYIRDFNLDISHNPHRPFANGLPVMDVYAEALVLVMARFNKQKLSRPQGRPWEDDEWTLRYLNRALNGSVDAPWRSEAFQMVRDLAASGIGWGLKNVQRAKKLGDELPFIGAYDDAVSVDRTSANRAPRGCDPISWEEEGTWTRAWDAREAREKALDRAIIGAHTEREQIQKKKEAAEVPKVVGTQNRISLPRYEEAIEKERLHWWREPTKEEAKSWWAPIDPDPPRANPPPSDPYMGSETLEFWDKEQEAQKRKLAPELSKRQRQVLIVREVGGYSDKQISKTLDRSESTVRSHASEATKRLRKTAEAGGETPAPAAPVPQPSQEPAPTRGDYPYRTLTPKEREEWKREKEKLDRQRRELKQGKGVQPWPVKKRKHGVVPKPVRCPSKYFVSDEGEGKFPFLPHRVWEELQAQRCGIRLEEWRARLKELERQIKEREYREREPLDLSTVPLNLGREGITLKRRGGELERQIKERERGKHREARAAVLCTGKDDVSHWRCRHGYDPRVHCNYASWFNFRESWEATEYLREDEEEFYDD